MHLRAPIFQKFSGGARPQTPLQWAAYAAVWASPTNLHPPFQNPRSATGMVFSCSPIPVPIRTHECM